MPTGLRANWPAPKPSQANDLKSIPLFAQAEIASNDHIRHFQRLRPRRLTVSVAKGMRIALPKKAADRPPAHGRHASDSLHVQVIQ